MTFDGLTNEAKLLFVISSGKPDWWSSQIFDAYCDAGGPNDKQYAAWFEVLRFLDHCREVAFDDRRRRKEQQKKAEARMRA